MKLIALLLAGVVASPCIAADREAGRSPKCLWEWSVEERLDVRFSPDRERSAEAIALQGTDPRRHVESIDGRRNPELFLPHELFDSLLSGFREDPDLRMKQRGFFERQICRAGFDASTFWDELEPLVADYLAIRDWPSGHPEKRQTACRARYDALEAARNLFGREKFDRLLYTAVAPSKQYSAMTYGVDPYLELWRAANGCR